MMGLWDLGIWDLQSVFPSLAIIGCSSFPRSGFSGPSCG